jgi:hypothetical protein
MVSTLPTVTGRLAIVSECERFRYVLGRRWGAGAPLLFVMLNPSTADDKVDDPTIRRCLAFAHTHGFPAIEVVNLFAFRAAKPAALKLNGWLVGPHNDAQIVEAAKGAGSICLAWGANAAAEAADRRVQQVVPLLRAAGKPLQCLRITASGHPQHPLMLRSDCRLHPFSLQSIDDAMSKGAR